MGKQPEITYERIVTLNKVLRVPDARYKSGYRKSEVLATSMAVIPEGMDGTTITQSHIHKVGSKLTQSFASSQVMFPLEKMEREI